MSSKTHHILVAARLPLAALLVLVCIGGVFWADLDAPGRAALASLVTGPRVAMILLLLLPALAAFGWKLYAQAQAALCLAESIGVITHANPAHRAPMPGTPELDAIARAVHEIADDRARALGDVAVAIAQAKSGLELERNRLAALIAELDQSVLVCNRDGQILLYNAAVSALLNPAGDRDAAQSVGLGRSAFGIIDRNLILHAIERIEDLAARGERESVPFITGTPDGRLLRVSVAPVFGGADAPVPQPTQAQAQTPSLTGFVLLLADVTQDIESDMRSVAMYQELVEGTRGALGTIRSAVDAMTGHPYLDAEQREEFVAVVQGEALRLGVQLDALSTDVSARLRRRWPLEEIRATDLIALVARRIERRTGLATVQDAVDPKLWLRVDSFSLVQAVTSLAGRLREEFSVRNVSLRLQGVEHNAHLDLVWKGVPMSSETAFTWQNDAYALGGEDSPLSLAQVMERHGGEAWYQRDAPSQTNYFRLHLPLASNTAPARARAPAWNRPEFYDFDLFHRGAAADAFDERRLAELSFTVFDTETTGLDPNNGDEIIAIGAARIVNSRLLKSETFETLVDPRREISPASVAVHNITSAMVSGQPRIGEVLPRFWRFAQDTVLVGHNAAFDMRFLQLKEASTGVAFRQPVLDTLLLATVVNPSENSQSLEDIAGRLGVTVIGRHTALGDALATAEVFLGLLPLLAARGIHTLGQARAASEKTFYARLKY
jgi:DNA polymerase-3 subunit epsilon